MHIDKEPQVRSCEYVETKNVKHWPNEKTVTSIVFHIILFPCCLVSSIPRLILTRNLLFEFEFRWVEILLPWASTESTFRHILVCFSLAAQPRGVIIVTRVKQQKKRAFNFFFILPPHISSICECCPSFKSY